MGFELGARKRLDDAAPVITGDIDDDTVMHVFRGWKTDSIMRANFNPWVEVDKANTKRDMLCAAFSVAPQNMAAPSTGLHKLAKDMLVEFLKRDRNWPAEMVDRYFAA